MNVKLEGPLRDQLMDRRQRLTSAIEDVREAGDLVRLLAEVDGALARMDAGVYGGCEVCHEEVEDDFLLTNPLIQYCLCNFTPEQLGRLQEDMGLAGRIQWALLPKQDLSFAGYETHFRYEPAGPVSGDYCDLVTRCATGGTEGDSLLFVVGDVSGKGFAASLLMAHLNAAFRSLVGTGLTVEQLVERANQLLLESKIPSHYVTLVCGRADATGEVTITNAGHCPPLVVREREVGSIGATGFPVGMFGDGAFTTTRIRLAPGESLFIYTDGLSEASRHGGEEYGTERLVRLLHEHRREPARRMAARALDDLTGFLEGARRADDLTLLVVRRAG